MDMETCRPRFVASGTTSAEHSWQSNHISFRAAVPFYHLHNSLSLSQPRRCRNAFMLCSATAPLILDEPKQGLPRHSLCGFNTPPFATASSFNSTIRLSVDDIYRKNPLGRHSVKDLFIQLQHLVVPNEEARRDEDRSAVQKRLLFLAAVTLRSHALSFHYWRV
ncbi:uncharacterized protein MYCFIDRAFT_172260 [Pseudocercospora fijiensis CIRAD86]|uniref:Uncharacterized protein n=1 Tax=Pseudocercospora fijiensis (strain CIRAD86) TaxID=383855 RepID=M3A5X5_PSEFD|nr:uncharacterized protein MYCFIDRAFT_172260 [Pseudocercospora fijiensis CIRAD86]EME86524.1 hypothetical protein MYCFIDRAFT_172260 [Pseudocercospora fijiensis CIRAD86]